MRLLTLAALTFVAGPALAAEPSGCDKFAWSIEKAQHLLASAGSPAALNDRDGGGALAVPLVPFGEAKLRQPPERPPKDPASFAGLIEFGPGAAATYAITLSAGAWIDVLQNGRYLKPAAFTGATGCPHVRKSVKFALDAAPFTVQLSGAPSATIDLVVTPAN